MQDSAAGFICVSVFVFREISRMSHKTDNTLWIFLMLLSPVYFSSQCQTEVFATRPWIRAWTTRPVCRETTMKRRTFSPVSADPSFLGDFVNVRRQLFSLWHLSIFTGRLVIDSQIFLLVEIPDENKPPPEPPEEIDFCSLFASCEPGVCVTLPPEDGDFMCNCSGTGFLPSATGRSCSGEDTMASRSTISKTAKISLSFQEFHVLCSVSLICSGGSVCWAKLDMCRLWNLRDGRSDGNSNLCVSRWQSWAKLFRCAGCSCHVCSLSDLTSLATCLLFDIKATKKLPEISLILSESVFNSCGGELRLSTEKTYLSTPNFPFNFPK